MARRTRRRAKGPVRVHHQRQNRGEDQGDTSQASSPAGRPTEYPPFRHGNDRKRPSVEELQEKGEKRGMKRGEAEGEGTGVMIRKGLIVDAWTKAGRRVKRE